MNRRQAGWRRLVAVGGVLAGLAGQAAALEPFDPARSSAHFRVQLRLAGDVDGHFRAVTGDLEPAPVLPASATASAVAPTPAPTPSPATAPPQQWRVRVQVDTRGLALDGPEWMLRSTRSGSFLDVDNHPRIDFVSDPFARELLRSGGQLTGTLTLRGRSRPVAFRVVAATCATPGQGCDIRVQGEVNRRDFAMTAQRLWLRDTVGFDFRVRLQPPAPR